MKKLIFGFFSIFLSLSLACGGCFLIEKFYVPSSQTEQEEEKEEEETKVTAEGNWINYVGDSWIGSVKNGVIQYYVYSPENLARLARNVNDNYYVEENGKKYYFCNANVILRDNIKLSTRYWTPIGRGERPFKGTFDGQGYTISGINISATRGDLKDMFGTFDPTVGYEWNWSMLLLGPLAGLKLDKSTAVGLFGIVEDAEIKNLNVSGSYSFTGDNDLFADDDITTFIGGAVGYAKGDSVIHNVNNVGLSMSISRYSNKPIFSTYVAMGGIAGAVTEDSSISDCSHESGNLSFNVNNDATQAKNLQYHIGGVVGSFFGDSLYNCYNSASIYFNNPTSNNHKADRMKNLFIGGIVGSVAQVKGSGDSSYIFISDNVNSGSLFISGYYNINDTGGIGGIIGYSCVYIYLTTSHNYGSLNIYDADNSYVGGVIGHMTDGLIDNCSNFGEIDLSLKSDKENEEERSYGGIAGKSNGRIRDCANYGDIEYFSSKTLKHIGGIVGRFTGLVDRCINYGYLDTPSGYYVGGIIGAFDVTDSDAGVINCVNTVKMKGTEAYQIYGVYYYNKKHKRTPISESNWQGLSLSLFENSNNWTTGSYLGYSVRGFNGIYANNYVSYYYSKPWTVTTQAVNYFYSNSNKGTSGVKWSFVPSSAIAEGRVNVSWKGGGYSYTTEHGDNDVESSVAEVKVLTFEKDNRGYAKVEWTESYSNYFYYLRGADYSSSHRYRNCFKVIKNTNFDLVDIKREYYIYDKNGIGIDKTVEEDVTNYTTSGNTLYLYKDNFMPDIYQNGGYFDTITYNVRLKSKQGSFETVVKVRNAVENTNNGNYGEVSFSNSSGLYYNDKVTFTATPEPGFALFGIYGSNEKINNLQNISRDGQALYLNFTGTEGKEVITNDGIINNSFNYNFQKYIYVLFYLKTWDIDVLTTWDRDTQDNVDMKPIDADLSILKSSLKIVNGYSYKIYLAQDPLTQDSSLPIKRALIRDSFDNNNTSEKIKITKQELFDGLKKLNLIEFSKFYLIIDREVNEYNVILHNMVNSYNQLDMFEQKDDPLNSIGGTSSIEFNGETSSSLGNLTVNSGDIVFNFKPKEGYELFVVALNNPSKIDKFDGTVDENATNINVLDLKTASMPVQISFKDLLDKYIKENKVDDSYTHRNLNLYVYYRLKTYNFEGSVEIDGKVENSKTMDIKLTTNEQTSENNYVKPSSFINSTIHYNASVTLNAQVPAGYKFAGFYYCDIENKNLLLTTASTYTFINKAAENLKNDEEFIDNTKNFKITAKYITYDWKLPEDYTPPVQKDGIYSITCANDLIWLSEQVRLGNTFEGNLFKQTCDIDLAGIKFNPIGGVDEKTGKEYAFKGGYDGDNYCIKNLTVAGGNSRDNLPYAGLFGLTDGASIKNLTLVGGSVGGFAYVGGVVGYARNTTFEYVNNQSCVISTNDIEFKSIYGNVVTEYMADASGTLEEFAEREYFGGLVGKAERSTFFACSNRATVSNSATKGIKQVAGLIGEIDVNCYVDQCFSVGALSENCGNVLANGVINGTNVKDCYGRSSGNDTKKTTFFNETRINGNLDSSIWIKVKGKDDLRVFYWS